MVALYATQDVYSAAPSVQREVAALLVQAWWSHQLVGNVATVALGRTARPFVSLPSGVTLPGTSVRWFSPGPGAQETMTQTGSRTPYERLCAHAAAPYASSRGWDLAGMSFTVQGAQGDVQSFARWSNHYSLDDVSDCGFAQGFRLASWTWPSGVKVSLVYGGPLYDPAQGGLGSGFEQLLEVDNSLGRRLVFNYTYDALTSIGNGLSGADARSVTFDRGTAGAAVQGIVDPAGKETRFVYLDKQLRSDTLRPVPYARLSQIMTADNLTLPSTQYDYDALGRIAQVRDALNLQIGDHTVAGGRDPTSFYIADGARGERDDPTGAAYTVYYDSFGHASRFIDELGNETDQTADGRGRVLSTLYPEHDQEQFTYDVRNNVLSRTLIPKPGSPEATAGTTLTASATYKEGPTIAACATVATCNKPATTVSANGWTTNYGWNSYGLLDWVKLPADASGNRPETDYTYTPFGADGFRLLTGTAALVTPTTSRTTAYDYDAANDYVPKTVIVDPSGLNLVTTLAYDAQGDLTHSDGPRTDVSDVSDLVTDLDRRPVLSVGPDPDGAGPHPRLAARSVYDAVGRVIETDRGTVAGSTFMASNWIKDVYDPAGERVLQTTGYNTTTTTALQTSYDGAGRVLCSTRRMNPAVYASLPSDACTLGTEGAYGPDRISKMVYDGAGQVLQEQRAVGTSLAQTYATHSYSPDGKELSVYDALGATHTTTYLYDGFDRLKKTTFADATFVQNTTLDADGNVKKLRTRAGESINYTFDRNDRMLTKAVPATSVSAANTVTWAYDLTGAVTNLSDTNSNTIANTYDAMGRVLTAAQTMPGMTGGPKTVTYAYDDGAGDKVDRSRVTWPDGYYVRYGYDALSHMISATDSDGIALATQTYDDLARPATIQYPFVNDNIVTAFSSEDDLVTMTNNLALAANDVSFTNSFTPAHQWATAKVSNAAFRYVPTQTGADAYAAVNGLNQYAAMTPAGGSARSLSYDTRGNLTGDGVLTLAYDPENRLMTASKTGMSATYAYDPLGRRKTKTVNGTATNVVHDGDTEIAEYTGGGALLRRYIPGPAIDRPIAMVNCTGTGCMGANAVKTMFHTDKMGSVIAMSNAAAGKIAEGPYTYDSWGNCFDGGSPCGTGVPYRFTGQRLDPETGLYYYRARCYSPSLGRFCQTDPIGYKDDLNLYLYTHDNPSNGTDPTGLATVTNCSGVKATCTKTSQAGKTFSGGTPKENLKKANLAVAPENAALVAATGNEVGNVFDQNDDGSVTVSVTVSDNSKTDSSIGMNEIRDKTDNPPGDQHVHPGLPSGLTYVSTLSTPDVNTADIISTQRNSPFNRTIIDGPSGKIVSFDGRPNSMVKDSNGNWVRSPDAPTTGLASVIGTVPPIPYVP